MTDRIKSVVSLTARSENHLVAARAASAGRSAHTIHCGLGSVLRQILLALAVGRSLGEHESPGEATLHVLVGRVRLSVGAEHWEAVVGNHLPIPPSRHDLTAIEDSVVLLSLVAGSRG